MKENSKCKSLENAETKNEKLKEALRDIFKLWPEANFKSETCPEAHLQSIIRKMRDIALECLEA
jgi:hypothetical protein